MNAIDSIGGEGISKLIAEGADVNVTAGADVNAKTMQGPTALTFAVNADESTRRVDCINMVELT